MEHFCHRLLLQESLFSRVKLPILVIIVLSSFLERQKDKVAKLIEVRSNDKLSIMN